jgi:mannose-6-phosphate isomerase
VNVPAVVELEGIIRPYAWGSRTAIPKLLGIEPDGRPAAELWFGAHPDDPARVRAHGVTLDALIALDPAAALGPAALAEYGPQLPFLLKILAAGTPLSMQVHPTIAQAQAGFAAEDAAGIARDAPQRNYRDRNHKPELLCALTEFDALCGFRPVADTVRLLSALGVAELDPIAAMLPAPDGLRSAFATLITRPRPAPLVAAVAEAARRIGPESEWAGPASAVAHTVEEFPEDIGVVLSLLLNHVRLRPGEAIYLGAGNVHAYVRGLGVEIMANSDNVLRCGLTPKHVDVPELMRVADFTALPEPRCPTVGEDEGVIGFETPASDFHLSGVDLDGAARGRALVTGTGPYIVLCTSGAARVQVADDVVELRPGRAAFVAARAQPFTVGGSGQAYLATVGE